MRMIDITAITRKEKQDLIDEKVCEFESNMDQIEETLNQIQQSILLLPTQEKLNALNQDKISKGDIYKYTPDKAQIKRDIERIVNYKLN